MCNWFQNKSATHTFAVDWETWHCKWAAPCYFNGASPTGSARWGHCLQRHLACEGLYSLHHHTVTDISRWLNKSPNLGNVSHKQGGIAETVKKCNGELGMKLAAIAVAVTLVVKHWGKAHWNAVMCLYLHSHWEPIRFRNPNAWCKSCWMLCIFCNSIYRGACFQFVPLVRHQSAYFDTLSGIFRKCNSANAFWTRYLETAIGSSTSSTELFNHIIEVIFGDIWSEPVDVLISQFVVLVLLK